MSHTEKNSSQHRKPRIALVCDWLTTPGGAEKVLLELHKMYPEAPIYTSQYRPKKINWFKDAKVYTGWLNYFPACLRKYLGLFRQFYFSHLDLSGYDLIISVTGAEAKAVKTKTAYHICYCHVPTQYYWAMYDKYLKEPNFGIFNPLARLGLKLLVKPLRRADYQSAQQPDQFVTISQYSAEQIKQYYHRDAIVIHPPVDIAKFSTAPTKPVENYQKHQNTASKTTPSLHYSTDSKKSQEHQAQQGFVIACRQVAWKRIDLAIQACLQLNQPLTVIGDGPEHANLVKLAQGSSLIKFIPWVDSAELSTYLHQAQAYIFPSLEPFGIAAVEALAAGCPVIAYVNGGSRDIIQPGKNGLLFDVQTPDSLAKTLQKFLSRPHPFKTSAITKSAAKFSITKFRAAITNLVQKAIPHPAKSAKSSSSNSAKTQSKTTPVSQKPNLTPASLTFFAKIYAFFLCLMPVILFFSYHPVISLGADSSMNFELSLPLIWLALFDIVSLIALFIYRQKLAMSPLTDRRFFLFSLFPLYATISIFWSANPVRGLLTALIIWAIFFAVFAVLFLTPLIIPLANRPAFKRLLLRVFFIGSALICLICWIQSFLDIFGASRASTLLCAGCTYQTFGFPHPSGFAIEPQFMGNLLLAPTLLSLYLLIFKAKSAQLPPKTIFTLILFAILFSTTLFFTFSRGAIYAYVIALLIMLIFALRRHVFRYSLIIIPVVSFLLSLTAQGTFAALSSTNDTFYTGIAKSLHQLSLGIIDIRSKATPQTQTVSESSLEVQDSSTFDGYVAESTNVRLDLNQAALDTWLSAPGHPRSSIKVAQRCFVYCCPCTGSAPLTPTSVLFGVGLGGAGAALYRNSFMTHVTSPKEIVQNQPLSLLLEQGIVGLSLIAFALVVAFASRLLSPRLLAGRSAIRTNQQFFDFWRHPALPLLLPLLAAYLITLNFFSGLPNALQIYLMPPLFYLIFAQDSQKTLKKSLTLPKSRAKITT